MDTIKCKACQKEYKKAGILQHLNQKEDCKNVYGPDYELLRQQILDDLKEEIFQLQNDPNHNVILFIDANKSLYTSKKNKLNQFIQSSKLVNIHQSLHPQLKETPTNVVGSRQIDYCFISTELIPNIERAGILPINYTMISDHWTLFIDIDTTKLFGGSKIDPVPIPPRCFKLNNVQATQKYIYKLKEYFKQHRIMKKLIKIAKGLVETD